MKKLFWLLLVSFGAVQAQIPISGLPTATTLTGTEWIPCVQPPTGGITKKCTATQIGSTFASQGLYATDSGAPNAYVLTSPAPVASTVGQLIEFAPAHTNTGPSTVSVNGGGALNIVNVLGSALTGGELSVSTWLQYTGSVWQIVGTGPTPDRARTANEILDGIIPTNYFYAPLNVVRYGADPIGVNNSTSAFTTCAAVGAHPVCVVPAGTYNLVTSPTMAQTVTWYFQGLVAITGAGSINAVASTTFSSMYEPPLFTNTQMNDPVVSLINGGPTAIRDEFQATAGGNYTTDGLATAVIAPATATSNQADGIFSWAATQNSTVNAFGAYGGGRCGAASSHCWGFDYVATNRLAGNGMGTTYSGVLIGGELDVDPGNVGDSTTGFLSLLNAVPATLVSYTGGSAYVAGGNDRPAILWNVAYQSQDNGANIGMDLGATCLSGTCQSQPIQFDYYTSSVRSNLTVRANNGTLYVNAPIFINQTGATLAITSTGETCTMVTGLTCTATVPSGSGHCMAAAQGSLPFYAACGVASTTATVTANAANSDVWLIIVTQ